MNKLLAAIVASTFALSCASGFAANAPQKEELTKDQRIEMRARADRLAAERATVGTRVKAEVKPVSKVKKHVKKTQKISKHYATKTHAKA
jgi:hypothetical protein